MDIHRVFNIDKGKDETYRQNYYKRLERAKAEIEKSFGDIFDIRQASAKLNQYATEFDMKNFQSMDKELNKVVSVLSEEDNVVKSSDIVEVYPSEEIIKLSRDIKEK